MQLIFLDVAQGSQWENSRHMVKHRISQHVLYMIKNEVNGKYYDF